jgi:hypothetical protein
MKQIIDSITFIFHFKALWMPQYDPIFTKLSLIFTRELSLSFSLSLPLSLFLSLWLSIYWHLPLNFLILDIQGKKTCQPNILIKFLWLNSTVSPVFIANPNLLLSSTSLALVIYAQETCPICELPLSSKEYLNQHLR